MQHPRKTSNHFTKLVKFSQCAKQLLFFHPICPAFYEFLGMKVYIKPKFYFHTQHRFQPRNFYCFFPSERFYLLFINHKRTQKDTKGRMHRHEEPKFLRHSCEKIKFFCFLKIFTMVFPEILKIFILSPSLWVISYSTR